MMGNEQFQQGDKKQRGSLRDDLFYLIHTFQQSTQRVLEQELDSGVAAVYHCHKMFYIQDVICRYLDLLEELFRTCQPVYARVVITLKRGDGIVHTDRDSEAVRRAWSQQPGDSQIQQQLLALQSSTATPAIPRSRSELATTIFA